MNDKISELRTQIENATARLERIQNELLRKARHNVKKRNRINKAFGIFKTALSCIPAVGGVAGIITTAAGLAIDYASNHFNVSDSYGYENAFANVVQEIGSLDCSVALGSLQNEINGIDLNNLGQSAVNVTSSFAQLSATIRPVCSSIINLHKVLSQSSAPSDQVDAEFRRLCSESVDYQNLITELNALQQSYEEFKRLLERTYTGILSLGSEVSNEVVSLDALRRDVFVGNSKRDLQAMQCVEKMKQRAMSRLIKYHYYMRKAYEYRLLKPYQGDFSLEHMYNRLEAMIDQGQVIFNDSTPVSPEAYNTLSALFREEMSKIVNEVIVEYNQNAPEQSAPITIIVPKEWLDIINSNENYVLNLHELGIFSPNEENIRIVDFGVQHIETHLTGNIGYSAYMDLELEHNGISRFRKNGEIYWFNHISSSEHNPHTWGIRYDAVSHEATTIEPSFASQSLLYSLLNTNSDKIMLFSRPSAWSDIVMSKKVHSSGNADIVIDSLVLRLRYDFTRRPDNIRNIDITTNYELLPFITCSETDRNGRSNGKGNFHRSYNRGGGTVNFTTDEVVGVYHFVNWTDRLGNVVSESPELTINKQSDQFYRANYEPRIPIISVADTIYVSYEGGQKEVEISNIGYSEIEMDWYVSDSLSTWVHLDGVAEGIDDGSFTFTYEASENNENRIDSLEILAPEIEGMSKMIYIVQDRSNVGIDETDTSVPDLKLYPNPTNESVNIVCENMRQIQIYSIVGKEEKSITVNGESTMTVSMNGLPAGLHYVRVTTDKGYVTRKVIKM